MDRQVTSPTWDVPAPCKQALRETRKEKTLYLSVNVFSTKVLIGDTIFTSPTGDGTAILRGHPSHAKVSPLAVQRKYLHFSVILRPWVLVQPRESNPRPPALQSSALLTELILPRLLSSCQLVPADWANPACRLKNLAVTWSMASERVMSCLLFWWKSSLQLILKKFIGKKGYVLLTLCMLYYF